jgi:hypothetical protein
MRKFFLMLAATTLLALPAQAMTPAQVQAEATALLSDYNNLSDQVDACPGGECTNAQALIDDFAALEAERTTLHSDRQSLGTGSYTQIDTLISQIDHISDVLSATFGGWDEQG